MLKELQIEDFALIDSMQLSFDAGFSVLTGETGAGKSIIIDALSLLLGQRASTEMIRSGADSAIVEASFAYPNSAAALLEEWGIDGAEDLVISRIVHRNGRSKCRIGGRLVSVAQLSELGPHMVDVLGQHHQQYLLASEAHLELLDSFGDQQFCDAKEEMARKYRRLQDTDRQLQTLRQDERERLRRMDLLQFQLEEIEAAGFAEDEEEALRQEESRLSNAERIQNTLYSTYAAMHDGTETHGGILEMLSQIASELASIQDCDDDLKSMADMFQDSLVQLEEVSRDLRTFAERYESDPERLSVVAERLRLLHDLKRKYGDTIAEINAYAEGCREELETLSKHSQHMDELEDQQRRLQDQCGQLAAKLSSHRAALAETLESRVEEELADLNMKKTVFRVDLESDNAGLSATGCDSVEFKISANVGEELKPLSKVASGGELSRIMLALKAILSRVDSVPTLVFDEVDTGIGGRTAHNVAEKLRTLAQQAQVLCVTHLPVIAGQADQQYSIEKEIVGERTRVTVQPLSDQGRVTELIRMLGSDGRDQAVVEHARSLVKKLH